MSSSLVFLLTCGLPYPNNLGSTLSVPWQFANLEYGTRLSSVAFDVQALVECRQQM